MDVEVGRDGGVDCVEEGEELPGAVASVAAPDHLRGGGQFAATAAGTAWCCDAFHRRA